MDIWIVNFYCCMQSRRVYDKAYNYNMQDIKYIKYMEKTWHR